MRSRFKFLCGTAAAAILAAGASAQQSATERVQVSGQRPAVQNLADRQVYTIQSDLQSATGSVSDVLRNLPSVEVDVEGNISLRGDRNVTVLIDGKRSAMLAGSLGEALEQIPADHIEKIEVITNPSAEFKAEGSGGVINIVMKKNADADEAAMVRLNVGNDGRFNTSASGSTKFGRYTATGNISYRRDVRYRTGDTQRGSDQSQTTKAKNFRQGLQLRLGAEAEFDARNTLAATLFSRFSTGRIDRREFNRVQSGSYTFGSERLGEGLRKRDNLEVSLEYTHAFARKGEELRFELQRGFDWDNSRDTYTNLALLSATTQDFLQTRSSEIETEARADYILPFVDGSLLKAGYNYQDELNDYSNFGRYFDGSVWTVDTDYTNRFVVDMTIHAAYATYDRKFGPLGVLAGLRLENTTVTADQRTLGSRIENSYLDLYPSLHLTYDLGEKRQLRLNYSRRINRPDDEDINPSYEYHDAFNVSAGNPYLKPEQTDVIEAGYKYTNDMFDTLLTGYFRRTRNGFTDVSRYISDTVVLTTRENLARAINAGLEFTVNGDIVKDLGVRFSTTGYYNEIDPGALALGKARSGLAWSGKLSLEYKITPDDQFQLSGNYTARRLTAQGYRLPNFTANVGYRHAFSDTLAGVVTAMNLFDSHKDKTVLDSGAVSEIAVRHQSGRMLYAGLVFTFGGGDGGRDEGEQTGENPE